MLSNTPTMQPRNSPGNSDCTGMSQRVMAIVFCEEQLQINRWLAEFASGEITFEL